MTQLLNLNQTGEKYETINIANVRILLHTNNIQNRCHCRCLGYYF